VIQVQYSPNKPEVNLAPIIRGFTKFSSKRQVSFQRQMATVAVAQEGSPAGVPVIYFHKSNTVSGEVKSYPRSSSSITAVYRGYIYRSISTRELGIVVYLISSNKICQYG